MYLIWYGTWDDTAANTTTQILLTDFLANVGGSPYFQINAMYPDGIGGAPSGALFYSGAVIDRYSHGLELTGVRHCGNRRESDRHRQAATASVGYLCGVASADVSSISTGLCAPATVAHHGTGEAFGSQFRYAFGNPNRCPGRGDATVFLWRSSVTDSESKPRCGCDGLNARASIAQGDNEPDRGVRGLTATDWRTRRSVSANLAQPTQRPTARELT